LFERVVLVYIRFLQRHQSARFLSRLFNSLRIFVRQFRAQLFMEFTPQLYNLLREVLRLCNFSLPSIRKEASSFFFLLILHNYREMGNFGRTYTQTTTALSGLITDGLLKDDEYIKRSLDTLTEYALYIYSTPSVPLVTNRKIRHENEHQHLKSAFARQVQELSSTLTKILRDTIEVNELKQKADPEMIADLYFRIAQGYIHTPDLRVTWLNELARFHDEQRNYVEAALCHLHVSSLILEYLKRNPKYRLRTQEEELFHKICPGLSEVADEEEEGSCQSQVFSESGLIVTLRHALEQLEKAHAYEYATEIYQLLLTLLAKSRMYQDMANCHKQLERLYGIIAKGEEKFENEYFRVGFFGRIFARLDGKQYVYREAKFTHLFDFTERMKKLVAKTYGVAEKNVEVLDAHKVDRNKLKEDTCYLQITYLRPYIEELELNERQTNFEQNTNLSTFLFQTPFTKGGKAHAKGVTQQWKRKTLLVVEHQFPYILKRLPVKSSSSEELNPLQVSIEEIEKRTAILVEQLVMKPPNVKTLQHVLQGSALPQVNQGAIEICDAFLGDPTTQDKYDHTLVERLQESLRQFLQACEKALWLNRKLVGEHNEFQRSMEVGFQDLQRQMMNYLEKPMHTLPGMDLRPLDYRNQPGPPESKSTEVPELAASSSPPHEGIEDEQKHDDPSRSPICL